MAEWSGLQTWPPPPVVELLTVCEKSPLSSSRGAERRDCVWLALKSGEWSLALLQVRQGTMKEMA